MPKESRHFLGWWDSQEEEGREKLQPSLHSQKRVPNTSKHVSLDFRHRVNFRLISWIPQKFLEKSWTKGSGLYGWCNRGICSKCTYCSPSGTATGGSEKSQQRTEPLLLFLWCCFHNNQVPRSPVVYWNVISLVWDIRERGTLFSYQYDL